MGEQKTMTREQMSLLAECYVLAAENEPQEQIRRIIDDKARRLGGCPLAEEEEPPLPPPGPGILDGLMEELTVLSVSGSPDAWNELRKKGQELPECGEKYYFLALMDLHEGRDESHRLRAGRNLSLALGYAPDDPVYRMLSRVIAYANEV